MQLVNQTRVRGSVIEFTFKHKSKKLKNVTIITTAINAENAQTKAWKEVRSQYKSLRNGLR